MRMYVWIGLPPPSLGGGKSNHPSIPTRFIHMAIRTVVVDHTDGLHEGINDDGADKFEAAFFRSLDMASDSADLTGASLNFSHAFWMGAPPTKSQR